MAKNQHTFAKRQREIEKKRKAEEKRAKRQRKKGGLDVDLDENGNPVEPVAGNEGIQGDVDLDRGAAV